MPQLDRIRSYSDCRFANLTRKQTWLQPYGVAERLFEATGLGMRVIVAPAPI
jgi:hypothetical protein